MRTNKTLLIKIQKELGSLEKEDDHFKMQFDSSLCNGPPFILRKSVTEFQDDSKSYRKDFILVPWLLNSNLMKG